MNGVQGTLSLQLPVRKEFSHWVPGENGEALKSVQNIVHGEVCTLWGRGKCGRTHLLQAVVNAALAHGRSVSFGPPRAPARDTLIVWDDVHLLHAEGQHHLFQLLVRKDEDCLCFILSANAPPRELALREDITSRMSQGLVYELRPLTQTDLVTALSAWVTRRGLELPEAVAEFILRRLPRELDALLKFFDVLDQTAWREKRALTIPLVRSILHSQQTEK